MDRSSEKTWFRYTVYGLGCITGVIALLFATEPASATIYAYTDSQGRVRVTDIPEKHGHEIVLPQVQTSSTPSSGKSPAAYTPTRNGPERFRSYVTAAARKHNLSESLIYAVMRAESNFNPTAVSPAGAQGLMQLIPSTARLVGVANSFDPQQNIMGGAKYLRMMIDRFGRVDHAVAAYNAGPEAVAKYSGIPPYRETRAYVPKVLKFYREYGGSGELRLANTSANSTPQPRSTASRKTSSSDNQLAKKEETSGAPIFFYRGPDGQIYMSNFD